MAAIKATSLNPNGKPQILLPAGTVLTGTGAVVITWFQVPLWAKYAKIQCVQTAASAGTNLISLVTADPITATDAVAPLLGGFALTGGWTGAGDVTIDIGPGVTGIANATAAIAGTGHSYVSLNTVLPYFLGLGFNGTNTDTYNVTASITLRDK